jgi:2-amino-4-hydroxy-6-hydroxymethyldihydropteridine diphosphokinase
MVKAILLLGTNLGDKHENLRIARLKCSALGTIIGESSIYESPAWGFESSESFYNQVLLLETKLEAEVLLSELLKAEEAMGRERSKLGYADRIVDMDLLDFGGRQIMSPTLEVPHPRLHLRKFTLLPLKEAVPHWVHPSSGKAIDDLLEDCTDLSEVHRLNK